MNQRCMLAENPEADGSMHRCGLRCHYKPHSEFASQKEKDLETKFVKSVVALGVRVYSIGDISPQTSTHEASFRCSVRIFYEWRDTSSDKPYDDSQLEKKKKGSSEKRCLLKEEWPDNTPFPEVKFLNFIKSYKAAEPLKTPKVLDQDTRRLQINRRYCTDPPCSVKHAPKRDFFPFFFFGHEILPRTQRL